MSSVKSLGEALRALRKETSLYEVEKQTAISRINLSRYEQGLHLPTERVLRKLAEFYETSYEDLRVFYYNDFFNKNPDERKIILRWARECLAEQGDGE